MQGLRGIRKTSSSSSEGLSQVTAELDPKADVQLTRLAILERMEGGKFHSVHSATTKAVCAASNKRNTGSTGAVGQSLDVLHALGLALAAGADRWTAMEGGCPIMAGNECIGGVGVAGGNFEFDERVAKEAAAAIKA